MTNTLGLHGQDRKILQRHAHTAEQGFPTDWLNSSEITAGLPNCIYSPMIETASLLWLRKPASQCAGNRAVMRLAWSASSMRLLMRYMDPSSGTVLVDGHDLRDERLSSRLNLVCP